MNNKKQIEKKMLIKKTKAKMNKQIDSLEEQKQFYIDAGKKAKEQGLAAQYNLAVSGLKMTIEQQKRVYEMKLNFELTSQMRDMSQMTTEFLKGLSVLSKDMMKLTKEKEFLKVQKEFGQAMEASQVQQEYLENFMDETEAMFESGTSSENSKEVNKEIDKLMENEASNGSSIEEAIDKELEELKKKM